MRVLMIDDHALFRMGLSELLERRGIEVVGAVGDCQQGIQWAEDKAPDIVLLDMRMPAMNGLEVLQELRRRPVSMPIAMLTTSREESDVVNALQGGARGYLLKDMEPEDVIASIERCARGELVVAPSMTLKLAQMLEGGPSRSSERRDQLASLTERERQILEHLARGESNKTIARALDISHDTVKLHVRHILAKLNLSSRVEAAVFAVEARIEADQHHR